VKILCLIRQVPDAEARVKASGGKVDLEGATMALDGMDEYGVEQALQLGGDLLALAIGPQSIEPAIRRALAMGLARAIHIENELYLDVVTQAKVIAQVARAENPDIIFTGGQSADSDSQALGAAVAEMLGWPQVTWTTALEISGQRVKATHDSDDGKEVVALSLPAVITTQQGLNEPRYPTLPNIMKAKSKPLEKKTLADYGISGSKVQVVEQSIQSKARIGKLIDGKDPVAAAHQLVELLHSEAKVI
jgi:electron transfer flavoprotein beta subunit